MNLIWPISRGFRKAVCPTLIKAAGCNVKPFSKTISGDLPRNVRRVMRIFFLALFPFFSLATDLRYLKGYSA